MDTNKSKGLDFAVSENYHWAGTTYHSLGGATDTYNPRLPVLVGDPSTQKATEWEPRFDCGALPKGAAPASAGPKSRDSPLIERGESS